MGWSDCLEWDLAYDRVRTGPTRWITTHSEAQEVRTRRIVLAEETIVPPRGQTTVTVRMPHNRWHREEEHEEFGVLESETPLPHLPHLYIARTIVPMQTSEFEILVLNARTREERLPRGTCLGKVYEAKPIQLPTTNQINQEETEPNVVEQMMSNLQDELTSEQRDKIRALLEEYRSILSVNDHDIGRTQLVEHTINTGDHQPIRQPLRRQPFQHQEYIDEETERMLEYGIIEPAASPWASNVILVKKKDGSLRFCVDYRQLNSITIKDSYPLPLIDNCLDALAGSSWFSTLDLRSGYYNVPIAEQDRDKSAFVTRSGCYRFTIMPFGLTCAPSVFQRLMDVVLCGLSYKAYLVYLDDIIVYGRTFDEQLERLAEVFDRLRTANLKLKPSKCHVCMRKVEFLGHVVSEGQLAMQSNKVDDIRRWPVPRTIRNVREFMGLA